MANFKPNGKGIIEVMRSEPMRKALSHKAELVRRAAGPGHAVSVWTGRKRARATVITTSYEAMLAQRRHSNLVRALDAAKGD